MKDSKRWKWLITLLVFLNLIISAGLIIRETAADNSDQTVDKYTIYVAINAQDENGEPIMSEEEASQLVYEICGQYVSGFTAISGTGFWVDDDASGIYDKSIVCSFTDVSRENIDQIADELCEALNQQCVLIEHSAVSAGFYYGS